MNAMASNPRQPLIDALAGKGWTLEQLRTFAGVRCTRASLHRKLYGYRKPGTKRSRIFQPLTVDEYRRLGVALGVLTAAEAAQLDDLAQLGSAA